LTNLEHFNHVGSEKIWLRT